MLDYSRNHDSDLISFGFEKEWPGVVVNLDDPLKKGRVKINVPKFYGGIPIEDIPWAMPRFTSDGKEFKIPNLGKVVNVYYPNGDIYHPEYIYAEHNNNNLQNKLDSLTEEAYTQFKALNFEASFQFYSEPTEEGMVLDYVKSKIQIMPDGNIILNLRDNASTMYLGSTEADQSALLGNRFIKWFDKFMKNMMGNFGGPYLGNMSAPVIANPAFLQVANEYFSIRQSPAAHFLSDRVKIVDNDAVIANEREYDIIPEGDEFKVNDEENTEEKTRIYQPSNVSTSRGSSEQVR